MHSQIRENTRPDYDALKKLAETNAASSHLGQKAREFWSKAARNLAGVRDQSKIEYCAIGIYERGDVLITGFGPECFLDVTYDLALVRNLIGDPYELSMGILVWPRELADFDLVSISELKAWTAAYDHGWLDWAEGIGSWPLRYALAHERIRDHKIWDYLYSKFPDTPLEDAFQDVHTIEAAAWLTQEPHTADRFYDKLRLPMQDIIRNRKCRDTPKIVELLYGSHDE